MSQEADEEEDDNMFDKVAPKKDGPGGSSVNGGARENGSI